MNLLTIKPDTLAKRDEALNENFSTVNEKVEVTARTADAGLEAAFDAQQKVTSATIDLTAHVSDKNNPHNVTVEQLGLANAYVYRGSVANYSALPSSPATGDVYNIVNADDEHNIYAGDNVAWNGAAWDNLSGVFDTSALEALISANAEGIAQNTKILTAHDSSITELTTQTQTNTTTLALLQTTVNAMETQIGVSAKIDDTAASGTTTYSSEKINTLVADKVTEERVETKIVTALDDYIIREGYHGPIAGYTPTTFVDTIDQNSWDTLVCNANLTVLTGHGETSWTKIVHICTPISINFGENWGWVRGEVPTIVAGGHLVLCWCGYKGIAAFVSPSA